MSNRNMPDIYRDECGGNSRYAPDNNPRDDEEDWIIKYFEDMDLYIMPDNVIKDEYSRIKYKGKSYEDCVDQLHKWFEEGRK